MTQERMSIEDLARFLPKEARFAVNTREHYRDGVRWFVTTPDESHPGWQLHGQWLSGIILDADGLTEIGPKQRWRAENQTTYWTVCDQKVLTATETGHPVDEVRHAYGNYWQTDPQAQAYADACKELAMRMHAEADE